MGDRDNSGRFKPGNKLGKGRPKRATQAQYLDRLTAAVPLAKFSAICERAVTDALAGDYRARQWIGEYLLGKPPQTLNIGADALLIGQIVELLKSQGIPASAVFAAMLQELASGQLVESEQDG